MQRPVVRAPRYRCTEHWNRPGTTTSICSSATPGRVRRFWATVERCTTQWAGDSLEARHDGATRGVRCLVGLFSLEGLLPAISEVQMGSPASPRLSAGRVRSRLDPAHLA